MKFKGFIKKANNTLVDKIFKALKNIPEYKKLSLDRQGEVAVQIAKMITGKTPDWAGFDKVLKKL